MKYCPRCGQNLKDDSSVCLNCGYGDKIDKVEYCPKCGRVLSDGVCRKCDYKKQGLENICPLCGRAILNGVCRKCGYQYKKSESKCPYCGENLVGGYCYHCKYKKGETLKYVIIILVIILGVSFLIGW